MFNKSVSTHPSTTQVVPECCKAKQICDKTINLDAFLHLIWLPINIRAKKCVTEFFLKILFR